MKNLLVIAALFTSGLAISQHIDVPEHDLEIEVKGKLLKKAEGLETLVNPEKTSYVRNENACFYKKLDSTTQAHAPQNFDWTQFVKVKIDSVEMYVLVWEKQAGHYKEALHHKHYKVERHMWYFMMDAEQYHNIKNYVTKGDNLKPLITSSIYYGFITDRFDHMGGFHTYNEESLLFKMYDQLKSVAHPEHCFTIQNSKHTVNGETEQMVYFRFPEGCYKEEFKIKESHFIVDKNTFVPLFIK